MVHGQCEGTRFVVTLRDKRKVQRPLYVRECSANLHAKYDSTIDAASLDATRFDFFKKIILIFIKICIINILFTNFDFKISQSQKLKL